jgi:hypothetical protein
MNTYIIKRSISAVSSNAWSRIDADEFSVSRLPGLGNSYEFRTGGNPVAWVFIEGIEEIRVTPFKGSSTEIGVI